jgi:hypothetical protein
MSDSPDFKIRYPSLLHLSYVPAENVIHKKTSTYRKDSAYKDSDMMK